MIVNVFLVFLSYIALNEARELNGCPNRAFIGCILQLKENNIQFDQNIVRVILGIDSEAKLLHTCRSYTNVLPCFRDRVLECGNEEQKETFSELGRALMFICSPFSMHRQKILLREQSCISKVLSMPISAGCKLPKKPYGDKLELCKKNCAMMPNNFTCSLKTWITEQNLCTLNDISNLCSKEATDFYADLQGSIFESSYPFVCDKDENILTTPVVEYFTTKTPEISSLFTQTQTKKPPPMFHISTEVTTSTAVSPKITPAQSPSLPSDMPSQSVSSARASLVVLLQKLLPLALKSNLTSLFSQKNEVAETSKEIEPVLIKQTPSYSPIYFNAIHVTPSTRLPIKHVTPTSTEIPQTFSSTQQQIRVKTTWRPWYFTAQRE